MTRFEDRPADWLSFPDALDRILSHARPQPIETVSLLEALGRALAEGVVSDVRLPPWDNSAMDGYAVRGEDVRGASPDRPVALKVTGVALSGGEQSPRVGPGEAVRIMTGAPLPPGADSVIRVEHSDREAEAGTVRIFSDQDVNWNVRPAGEDLQPGEPMFAPGTTLGAGQLSVLSALGRAQVQVHKSPSVAIVTSGNELAGPEQQELVRAGKAIPDTNRWALQGGVLACGCQPRFTGIARDEPESVRDHLLRGRAEDVLVTVGGASMGEGDLFKRVLDELGYRPDFWRVRMRPGTPFGFGLLPRDGGKETVPVFGLPGNPASAFVCFELLVRPFLLMSAGHRRIHRPVVAATARDRLPGKEGFTHFSRVRLIRGESGWDARLTGPQGSGLVQSLGRAEGLAVTPEGGGPISEGESVEVILLGDGPGWLEEVGVASSNP